MKKFVFLGFALFLAACGNKYQETGLLCEDAEHNSGQAQITLDVNADNKVANIVVNGESMTLTAAPEKESTHIMYYGKNTNDETVKLIIGFSKDGKTADSYMLGINSGETVYGCYKIEFTTHPEGDADFITFVNQQRQNWDENAVIISEGERGDFLNYIDETPEILQIYNNKEKTAMFLSIENPAQYIKPGKCLVNTIGYDILKEMAGDNEASNCSWRLFCGTEMNYDGFYAVELCGDMVSD